MITYSIITPIKNEIENIQKTINSVVNQFILPFEWIIIDDGFNDGSEIIIGNAAEKYNWIKVIKCEANILRDYSSRVVFLFNFGYEHLSKKVDFISKLDADVSFEPTFYKNILEAFNNNPKLGIASGHLTINRIPKNMKTRFTCTRGATKIYRTTCLEDIGGIISFQGWDTLDNVAARSKGWEVAIISEYFEHLKEEGSKVGNKYYSSFRSGFYNRSIPYLWSYFLAKILSKITSRPIIIGSFLQLAGYIKGRYFNNVRPFPEFIIKQLHFEQKETLKSFLSK